MSNSDIAATLNLPPGTEVASVTPLVLFGRRAYTVSAKLPGDLQPRAFRLSCPHPGAWLVSGEWLTEGDGQSLKSTLEG